MNRRRLLSLLGLGGLGVAVAAVGKWWRDRAIPNPTVTYTPSPGAAQAQAPQPSKPANSDFVLRLVATADVGAHNENQFSVGKAMAAYHAKNPYPLVLLAGDNIYDNGEIELIKTAFEDPYQALLQKQVKFRAILGNHDIRSNNGNDQVKYAGYNMDDRYYTFREKNVQFFGLDTNGNADWDAQLAWLDRELSKSDATWKIVYGHHPIYASGHYGTNPAFVKIFAPLFKKHGVQLYINGHEHHYERSHPIDGTTYLVTGHGGAYLRPVGRQPHTAYSVSRYGFSALTVYGDRIEIEGIGTDGSVYDRGIIPLNT